MDTIDQSLERLRVLRQERGRAWHMRLLASNLRNLRLALRFTSVSTRELEAALMKLVEHHTAEDFLL